MQAAVMEMMHCSIAVCDVCVYVFWFTVSVL